MLGGDGVEVEVVVGHDEGRVVDLDVDAKVGDAEGLARRGLDKLAHEVDGAVDVADAVDGAMTDTDRRGGSRDSPCETRR